MEGKRPDSERLKKESPWALMAGGERSSESDS